MASAGNEDEENYWPGYVDALTTMTMVLTFVMMILGVMVFVLSQDAASSRMRAIARALQVNEDELKNLDNEDLRSVVQAAIDAAKAAGHPGAGGLGGSGGDAPGGRLAGSGGMGTGAAYGPGGAGGGGIGVAANMPTEGRDQFETSFKGGLVGQEQAGLGGEYKVTQDSKVAGVGTGRGSELEAGPGALRFVFENNSLELPAQGEQALEAFVASVGLGSIVVEGSANPDFGLSEGRRRAYFRALLVRNHLVRMGVKSEAVTVRILDVQAMSVPETVDIKRGGAR